MTAAIKDLPIGHEFPPVTHSMTQERMSTFSDMEHSNTAGPGGRLQLAPRNIHNNLDFARNEGLPNTIADGTITTAWIEAQMRELFGAGYMKGGKLMTKYIKPVFAGDTITIRMTLKNKVVEDSATRIVLDILSYNQKGELVTVASGSGLVV